MKKIILLFLLNQFTLSIYAQNEMFIEQLSNREIVRKNFNEDDKLIRKQIFTVGKVEDKDNFYEIEVVIQVFDDKEKPVDKFKSIYRCEPDELNIMLMIFPFSKSKSTRTKINSFSKNFKDMYDLNNLKDIDLEINFDSGMLDFFGSKSKIKIYDRILNQKGEMNYITSKLDAKAYAFGMRIKQFKYTVREKLDLKGLLIFQKFTEQDGSYFTMKYTSQKD